MARFKYLEVILVLSVYKNVRDKFVPFKHALIFGIVEFVNDCFFLPLVLLCFYMHCSPCPSPAERREALVMAIVEILWKAGKRRKATVSL